MSEVTLVELPKLYENMDEATIGPWQVGEGDTVTQGQFIVELITDKMTSEFEAPVDGTLLKIYGQEKSTVPHGYVLCAIGPEGAQAPDMTAFNEGKIAELQKATAGGIDVSALGLAPAPVQAKPSFKAAPAAKVFARQNGVELADVAAFCGREMIHRKDVEDYIASRKAVASAAASASVTAAAIPSVTEEKISCGAASSPSPSIPAAEAIEKRVALVTGATGGIGSAIVRRLAKDGVAVAIHYHSGEQAAKALSAELTAAGVENDIFQSDLAGAPENCQKLVDAVMGRFGRLDILVNNAGCLADGTVSFMSDAQWENVLSLCLTVPFRLIRACSMNMARRRWGRIVNMSSDAGRMGSANRSNYSSAKEGLCGLTRSAAQELATMGVRVNAVSPGFIDSPMTADIPDRRRQELLKSVPVHRFGKPEEVASLVAFLCSDQADYITGQVISINGGLCM